MTPQEMAKHIKEDSKFAELSLVFFARRHNTVSVVGIESDEVKEALERMGFEMSGGNTARYDSQRVAQSKLSQADPEAYRQIVGRMESATCHPSK